MNCKQVDFLNHNHISGRSLCFVNIQHFNIFRIFKQWKEFVYCTIIFISLTINLVTLYIFFKNQTIEFPSAVQCTFSKKFIYCPNKDLKANSENINWKDRSKTLLLTVRSVFRCARKSYFLTASTTSRLLLTTIWPLLCSRTTKRLKRLL